MFFVDNNGLSPSHSQGRLAVEYKGTVGYYCNDMTSLGSSGPSTLCRLMGFPRGGRKLDTVTTQLPEPMTYPKSWRGSLSCGQWDRNLHFVSCIPEWQQEETYSNIQDEFGNSDSARLTHCGQNLPAISCFEMNCELLCHWSV